MTGEPQFNNNNYQDYSANSSCSFSKIVNQILQYDFVSVTDQLAELESETANINNCSIWLLYLSL